MLACRKKDLARNLKTDYALDRQCIKGVHLSRAKSMSKDTSAAMSL